MAKNYTFAEAVRIINEGKDIESITDIGRRFPVLLHKVTKVTTKAGEDFADLMNFMPDFLTANKVNNALKANAGETTETETEVEVDADETTEETATPTEKKATKPAAKKVEKAEANTSDSNDYESMSGKQLWDILGKAGKRKDCKDKMGGVKKDDMVAYINKYGLGEAKVEETKEEVEEVEATETTEANAYDGKSAMELFKECKKRGIKVEAKKTAKYYADLLIKDDAAKATEETESESDDWDDDEVVEEAPKKAAPKKTEKPAKKAAPKAKTEEADDDDDWDI